MLDPRNLVFKTVEGNMLPDTQYRVFAVGFNDNCLFDPTFVDVTTNAVEKATVVLGSAAGRDGAEVNSKFIDIPATFIEMAGAENALSGFEGYKPVTDEAVLAAAPDVILMMDRGVNDNHDALDAELFALPAISATPAGRNRALIRMNGQYLLGFGPRTAEAVRDLGEKLAAATAGGSN